MNQILVRGAGLESWEAGTGEPVLFVHGSASDCRTWQAQLELFAERYRAVAYSRRYHWPNEPIGEGVDYTMGEQVDDLEALVRSLGEGGAVQLVGHSYGAVLCLLLAMRAPGLVRSLVLAEPPVLTLFVSIPPRPAEILGLLLRRPRTAVAILRFALRGVAPAIAAFQRGDPETGLHRYGAAVFGPGGYERLSTSRKAQVQDNLTNVRTELLGPGFDPLPEELVRDVRVPTLLVTGERSIALFHRLANRLAELLPAVERVEIPRASHLMHEDEPAAFAAAVLAFVTRCSAASRPTRLPGPPAD